MQGWLNPVFMLPSLRRDIRITPDGSTEEESVPGRSFKRASQKRGDGNLALEDGIPGRGEEQESIPGGGSSNSNGTDLRKGR